MVPYFNQAKYFYQKLREMRILLVDDDSDDQVLFQEVIQEINPEVTIETAGDGEDAIQKLLSGNKKPDLMLLDINMPRMNGRDCLKYIRSNGSLCDLSVVVISTSISKADESLFSMLNAPYMRKPHDYESLVQQLRSCLASVETKHPVL